MQMTRTEIIQKLRDILLTAGDENRNQILSCTESARLKADLGFTSVTMLYMVIAMEETFPVRFESVSMSDFETLGDVVDYLEARLS